MKILKRNLPGVFFVLLMLFVTSCTMATAVPEIYLKQSDIKMELKKEAYGVDTLYAAKDGKYMLTGSMGNILSSSSKATVDLWDLAEGRRLLMKASSADRIHALAMSPDGKYAAAGGWISVPGWQGKQAVLEIWDRGNGQLVKRFKDWNGPEVGGVNFSPDGKYLLATVGPDIHLIGTKTWSVVKTLTYDYQKPTFTPYFSAAVAAFSPDGKLILSGGADGTLRLWDVETGRELRQFPAHKSGMMGGVSCVAFTSDGKYALTSGWHDDTVMLWDINMGQEVRRFSGFESYMFAYVSGLTLSPDGERVLIEALPLKIWDVQTGKGLIDIGNMWKGMKTASIGKAQYHPDGRHILLTWSDPAVRVYDIKNGEETAVFIGFNDGEWLVITSEGYYNSSEKGAQYLNVRIGEKSYGVDSFYDVFYRPDIVAAKLRGEDIKDLMTLTMKDAIKSPPPLIEIGQLDASATSEKAKVCYSVKSAGGGIGEVRVFHNGKLIDSDGFYKEATTAADKTTLAKLDSKAIYEDMRSVTIKEKTGMTPIKAVAKGESYSDCKDIDTIPGENEITVSAFNKDNTVQGYMQTARFTSNRKAEEPHLFILSIGIDRYKDPTIDLKYAAKDAADINEKILRQAQTLYKPENIHHTVLTDAQASKANISRSIEELSKRIKPTDSFILFAAGHGVLLQNQYYMLTSEYGGSIDEKSLVSSNEIVEFSKRIKSLNQLFIFDTCHAGGVDYIVSGLYDARMSVLAKKMGLHIYASASDKQSALDGYKDNGLFTYTLLDGLNNKSEADRDGDRRISLTELGEFSRQATSEISKGQGHAQTPIIINFGKDVPIYSLR